MGQKVSSIPTNQVLTGSKRLKAHEYEKVSNTNYVLIYLWMR